MGRNKNWITEIPLLSLFLPPSLSLSNDISHSLSPSLSKHIPLPLSNDIFYPLSPFLSLHIPLSFSLSLSLVLPVYLSVLPRHIFLSLRYLINLLRLLVITLPDNVFYRSKSRCFTSWISVTEFCHLVHESFL